VKRDNFPMLYWDTFYSLFFTILSLFVDINNIYSKETSLIVQRGICLSAAAFGGELFREKLLFSLNNEDIPKNRVILVFDFVLGMFLFMSGYNCRIISSVKFMISTMMTAWEIAG
jgi:hypothetical protein